MLTFNVILGYQGLLFRDFLCFLFFGFFFSIRLTDPISGNAFDGKRRKKGDGLKAEEEVGGGGGGGVPATMNRKKRRKIQPIESPGCLMLHLPANANLTS